MSNVVRMVPVDGDRRELINLAMFTLEEALEATVWAVMGTDERGSFIWPRPNSEQNVMAYLATIDWHTARRLTEEHIP